MTDERAVELLAEHKRRTDLLSSQFGDDSSILAELQAKQRAVAEDESRAISVLGDRRSGKTFVVGDMLHHTAGQHSGWDCLYLNPTAKQARLIMWEGPDGLKGAAERHKLHMKFHNASMVATNSNGSRIMLGGAETREDIEYWRGFKFKKVVIDEAGAFKAHLEELIQSVLQPTLMDLDGALVLAGTPGRILAGLFYEASRQDGLRNTAWSAHHLTVLDNPIMKNPQGFHDWVLKMNGWSRDHPRFRREYLGEWVREDSTLVYRFFTDGRNNYTELPSHIEWFHILALDLGYEDDTSFRVITFSPKHRECYFGESFKQNQMTISEIAAITKKWDDRYHFIRKVADAGALGKQIVAELNERHGLSFIAAEKKNKPAYIEAMNDDLHAGHIKVKPGDPIIEEWAKLQWADELRRIEDPRFDNHDSDASLYGWRDAKHFMYQEPVHIPKRGEDDWHDYEAARMEQLDVAEYEKRQERPWWDDGA